MSGVVAYTLKKLWLTAAVLLVVVAVLLSLFRYALPHADSKKHLVEQYAYDKFGIELRIGSISASWQGSGPNLILDNVSLSQGESSPVNFTVDKVWVDINFWQSISQRILISDRFQLDNPQLVVQTEPLERSDGNTLPVVEALKDLFLVQLHQFTVTDGQITLLSESREQVFELHQLTWLNEAQRHQGMGEIRVQELANNSASFVVELTGDTESLSGSLFAKAETLDISPWINDWLPTQYPLQESRANVNAWITFVDNKVDHLHIGLEETELTWQGLNEESGVTEISGGTIQALPNQNGWTFRVDQLVITQDHKTFVTDLIGQADNYGNALVNTVKPVALEPILGILPLFVEPSLAKGVRRVNPQGELATMQINWQSQVPSVHAKFVDLAWQQHGDMPGFSQMDAEFYWHDDSGKLRLHTDDANIDATNLLGREIAQTSFDLNAYLYFDQQAPTPGWTLFMPKAEFTNEVMHFEVATRVNLVSKDLSLVASIDALPLSAVPELFPNHYMGKHTAAYLGQAFSGAGEVKHSEIIWSGAIDDFPYEPQQGIFQSSVNIKDAEFTFSPHWPALQDLDINLLFENETLFLHSDSGKLSNIALSQIHARIPRLVGSSGIHIAAKGNANSSAVAELMANSSLKQTLGSLLNNDLLVDGELEANLLLRVPFSGNNVHASGSVNFNNADLVVSAIGLEINNIYGNLFFNNESIDARDLTAVVFAQPLGISLSGSQQPNHYDLSLDLDGDWGVETLLLQSHVPLQAYLGGSIPWQGKVAAQIGKQDFNYQASLQSTLTGATSTLPTPLQKESGQAMALRADVSGNNDESNISIDLGQHTKFIGTLNHKPLTFSQALVEIGHDIMAVPSQGFNIFAHLPEINVDQWLDVIQQFSQQQYSREVPLFRLPDRIAVETDNLLFQGQQFTNARVNSRQQDSQWRFDVVSNQAIGTAVVAPDWQRDGVTVVAEKLYLSKRQDNHANTEKAGDKEYFPLRFRCQDCRLQGITLGKIDLELNPTSMGARIDRLNINHPHASLRATGEWNANNEQQTTLTGEFSSGDFGQWLGDMAFKSGIKDSEAAIDFALTWPGNMQAFDLASFTGEANWKLSDGYLTEISDKGSRIFTLFSLNSLVRKLSLDFRDVFAKGFFYDQITGTINFANGKASTKDTLVDGGAGEIEIAGYSELVTGRINYDISFTPNVTGNLPVLVYFLASPPTAIAALALDQMLTSAKVISNINYQVTGTFNEPEVIEVGRDSKEVALPAQLTIDEKANPEAAPVTEADGQRIEVNIGEG